MLLRETLETVLSSPAPTLGVEDTLIEQAQSVRIVPGWKWLD